MIISCSGIVVCSYTISLMLTAFSKFLSADVKVLIALIYTIFELAAQPVLTLILLAEVCTRSFTILFLLLF